MSSTVAVIIVNFNSGGALTPTMDALEAAFAEFPWDGVVIDNASSDGSERPVLSRERFTLLRQPGNTGFAAGVNAGISMTSAPFVLILNPDCRLTANSGQHLFEELQKHPRCALIGPKILNPDGTLQESARGDPNVLTGLFGRTTLLSRLFPGSPIVRRNLVSSDQVSHPTSSRPVDWISGACMLARREALTEVKGFDEGYFLYWEDADICRRLRGAGWEIRYLASAVVVHDVGRSSMNVRGLANREFHRSAYRYFATHVVPQRWHPGRALGWLILMLRWRLKSLTG